MLKQGILTVLITMLFAVTPTMAADKDKLSQDYKDNLEANRESKGMPHPAHEMGANSNPFNNACAKLGHEISVDSIQKCRTYLDNLEANMESKNMPHPAHQMGKGNPLNAVE